MRGRRLSEPGPGPSAKRARVDPIAIAEMVPYTPAWWEAVIDHPSFDQEVNRVRVRKQQQAELLLRHKHAGAEISTRPSPTPNICLFCLDRFPTFKEKLAAPCSHIYHSQCLPPWRVAVKQNPNDAGISLCKAEDCQNDLKDFITATTTQPKSPKPWKPQEQDHQYQGTKSLTISAPKEDLDSNTINDVDRLPAEASTQHLQDSSTQDLAFQSRSGSPDDAVQSIPSPSQTSDQNDSRRNSQTPPTLTIAEWEASLEIKLITSAANNAPCAHCGRHKTDADHSMILTTVQVQCGHYICFDCLQSRSKLFALGASGVDDCGILNSDGSTCPMPLVVASDYLMQITTSSGFDLPPGENDRKVVCTLCQTFQEAPEQWYQPPCMHPHCFSCVQGLFEAFQSYDTDDSDDEDTKHDCEKCTASLERLFENLLNEAGDKLVPREQIYEKPPPESGEGGKKTKRKTPRRKTPKKPEASNDSTPAENARDNNQPGGADSESEDESLSEYKDIPNLARYMRASHNDFDGTAKQAIAKSIKQMRERFSLEIENVVAWQYGKDNTVANLSTMATAADTAWSVLQSIKIDTLLTTFSEGRVNAAVASDLPILEPTAQNSGTSSVVGQNVNSQFDWIISLYASIEESGFLSRPRLLYASVAIAEQIGKRGTGVTVKKIISDVMAREDQLRRTSHPLTRKQRQDAWERRRRAGVRLLPLVKQFGYGVLVIAPSSMDFVKVYRWDVETAHIIAHYVNTSTSIRGKQIKSLLKICSQHSDAFLKSTAQGGLTAALDTILVYMVGKLLRLNPKIEEDRYLSEVLKLQALPAGKDIGYPIRITDLLSLSIPEWPTVSAVAVLIGSLMRIYSKHVDTTIFPHMPWQVLRPRQFFAGDTPKSTGYLQPALEEISTPPTMFPVYYEYRPGLGLPGTASTSQASNRREGVWLLVILNVHLAPAKIFHFAQSGHLAASQLHKLLPSALRDAAKDKEAMPKNIDMGASNITVDSRRPMDQAIAMLMHATLLLKDEKYITTRKITDHTQRHNYALDLFHAALCATFPDDADDFRRMDDAMERDSIRMAFQN